MANPHRNGLDKHIENLENAINFIKRNGMDYMFTHELIEANKLLLQLKKRYFIYNYHSMSLMYIGLKALFNPNAQVQPKL